MAKAYQCDRCKELWAGKPDAEFIVEGRAVLVGKEIHENVKYQYEVCRVCFDAFRRFLGGM